MLMALNYTNIEMFYFKSRGLKTNAIAARLIPAIYNPRSNQFVSAGLAQSSAGFCLTKSRL